MSSHAGLYFVATVIYIHVAMHAWILNDRQGMEEGKKCGSHR